MVNTFHGKYSERPTEKKIFYLRKHTRSSDAATFTPSYSFKTPKLFIHPKEQKQIMSDLF